MTKTVFLVPFFGKLPPFFKFWSKSCEANHEHFQWFVYIDQIRTFQVINKAITMVPYQYDEMAADFQNIMNVKIPADNLRKISDYRILFYFLRKDKEPLDEFDFIGYTDIDMIYGHLNHFLPPDMKRYSMISGDDNEPCGPFTLIRYSTMKYLREVPKLKECLEAPEHLTFNESQELMKIVEQDGPLLCQTDPLQPARTPGYNHRKTFSIWQNGMVTVYDIKGNKKQGGFYHFSRYKDKKRFKITDAAVDSNRWGICKYGIIDMRSKQSFLKLMASLIF